jgi:uncharacterized protein YcbK (DUF882 family)
VLLSECASLLGGLLALSPTFAPAMADPVEPGASVLGTVEPLVDVVEERAQHLMPPPPRERSKKEGWMLGKATRRDVHVEDSDLPKRPARARAKPRKLKGKAAALAAAEAAAAAAAPPPVGTTVRPVTTLYNLWTRESLAIGPGFSVEDRFHPFLRDHFTNQATRMDVRLIDVLTQVARRFKATRIEVVSGYRSPKYNLMLRKKGREVARTSQHMEGHAVDFRVRGVPATQVLRYARSLKRGGVGYYPRSQFVHCDTGRIRYWRGS